jgi:hypothetical protein
MKCQFYGIKIKNSGLYGMGCVAYGLAWQFQAHVVHPPPRKYISGGRQQHAGIRIRNSEAANVAYLLISVNFKRTLLPCVPYSDGLPTRSHWTSGTILHTSFYACNFGVFQVWRRSYPHGLWYSGRQQLWSSLSKWVHSPGSVPSNCHHVTQLCAQQQPLYRALRRQQVPTRNCEPINSLSSVNRSFNTDNCHQFQWTLTWATSIRSHPKWEFSMRIKQIFCSLSISSTCTYVYFGETVCEYIDWLHLVQFSVEGLASMNAIMR